MNRTKTGIRLPKLPKALPAERGRPTRASYDESRKWLWEQLSAGDRGVANALWFWGNGPAPKGVISLPKVLDEVAIRAAAQWVRKNPARVAAFVALARRGR